MASAGDEAIEKLLTEAIEKANRNGVTASQCCKIINTCLDDKNCEGNIQGNVTPPKKKEDSYISENVKMYLLSAFVLYAVVFFSPFIREFRRGKYSFTSLSELTLATFGLFDIRDMPCIVEPSILMGEMARPLASCDMCRGLTEVPRLDNLSKERFLNEFAYSGKPLLVTDATSNWTAMYTFNYTYFRNLYDNINGSYKHIRDECQFFPYKTRFRSLKHVMRMSQNRSKLLKDQWYIGWSNCNVKAMKEIRSHYTKPYFLPDDAESSNIDWMFMGGSGEGAQIHLDHVIRPSWQAQIIGKKTWNLFPPPECEDVCHPLNATMNTGDVVIVDTNIWYHSTFIHPGEMSLTIGTEYD